jgi:hypothetical protein
MTGEVPGMKLIAKFELWCFVSMSVVSRRNYANPNR